ncbi:2,3-bisphosphoglycerate-independent phosphoglycerate mutase-like, partial [Paramuricea clavata]
VCAGIRCGKYPFVMCNFAAPDMVGHTGQYEPAVKACTATDMAIGKIKAACEENGYILFITADHGNAEKMYSEQGGPHTAHTNYRVPLIMNNTDLKLACPGDYNAALCDVATTILDAMGIELAPEMTGRSLLAN